jgi:hypothetical protein
LGIWLRLTGSKKGTEPIEELPNCREYDPPVALSPLGEPYNPIPADLPRMFWSAAEIPVLLAE